MFNDLQVLIMFKDSEPMIINTLNSWIGIADSFFLVEAGRSSDNCVKLIKQWKKTVKVPVVVKHIDFEDFSQARNECINLSYNLKYTFTIFIDDTYCFQGDKNKFNEELNSIRNNSLVNIVSLRIVPKGIKNVGYLSKRIFRTYYKPYYNGKLHETIADDSNYEIKSCVLLDNVSNYDMQRTSGRSKSDLKLIENSDNPGDLFNVCRIIYREYLLGNSSYLNLVKCMVRRINLGGDMQEVLDCRLMMANACTFKTPNYLFSEKLLLDCIDVFPKRNGEVYYKLHTLTNKKEYLISAYEFRDDQDSSILSLGYYGNNGLISERYCIMQKYSDIIKIS